MNGTLGVLFGVEITEPQQQEIVDLVVRLIALVGGIVAWAGRVVAKDRIV